jgi:hypothetical protein
MLKQFYAYYTLLGFSATKITIFLLITKKTERKIQKVSKRQAIKDAASGWRSIFAWNYL